MKHADRLIWLDLCRGLSALAVCAGHLRAAIFADFSPKDGPAWLLQPFYFLTSLGHSAVIVFFVLSGFFVGGSVLGRGEAFTWKAYGLARLSRLWVVLVPALVLTCCIDQVSAAAGTGALEGAFQQRWSSGPKAGTYDASPVVALGNLAFLQTIFLPVYGSNGPLWSLSNEFWYYLAFPLAACACALAGRAGTGTRIVLALAAAACVVVMPPAMRTGFVVWLMGVSVWHLVRRRTRAGDLRFVLAGCVLLAVALVLAKMKLRFPFANDCRDLFTGLSFALVAYGLAGLPSPVGALRPAGLFARASSEISYSLYVVHFPFVVLLGATLYAKEPLRFTASGLFQYTLGLLALIALGTLFWWLFERRTEAVRRTVNGWLEPSRRKVAG